MEDRGFDLERRLEALEDASRRRTLAPVDRIAERGYFSEPPHGGLPVLQADEALVFASSNYLGLTADQRIQNAARQAAATVGTSAGSSRLAAGDTIVHHDLERLLAETSATARALTFSSRYAANVGAITALEPDVIFADEENHASSVDGCRLSGADVVSYAHCDPEDLRNKLEARADDGTGDGSNGGESWLIVTDSVFTTDGAVAPLTAVCDAAETFGAWVMVDEAHASGLYANGGGIVQAEGLEQRVQVQVGALSKALASQGGYVCGDESLIECLLNDARSFAFSTGLAPCAAAAASEALHVARHDDCRERLWENVAHLRDGLRSMGYAVLGDSQILPILVGDQETAFDLVAGVRERGVVAWAVHPPQVPDGASRIRLAPTAAHQPADVMTCLEAFQAAGEESGIL